MKRFCSVMLSLLLLLAMLPAYAVVAQEEEEEVVVNVKDFGAKGDGVTSDRSAIMSAFNYAITHYASKSIPVTVYFPEGQYGLKQGGMYVDMPFGSGNLTVKGDGADKSTIVYLEEWTNGGSWVALRFKTEQEPQSAEDYLHDITIQNLGVYDTNPVEHAWSADAGDPGTEETHGFNIQYCVRAKITNCKVANVGDEAIDMTHCIDSEMTYNFIENSPGAGSAGGAISVGDESFNVLIAHNTVISSITNKTNWAIAVEALLAHIESIYIFDNIIHDMGGWGIHIGAPAGTIADVVVEGNTIIGCRDGGIRTASSGQTTNVQLIDNTIQETAVGINIEGSNKDQILIENCLIDHLSNCGVSVGSPNCNDVVIRDTVVTNSMNRAIYNGGTNTKIEGLFIDSVGLAGGVSNPAITQYASGGSCEVVNTVMLNCQNKKAIQGAQKVVNVWIQQPEISAYVSISGALLIRNCRVNRMIQAKGGSTIDGLVLSTQEPLGTHAVTLSNLTGCTVTKSVFIMANNKARYAVYETGANVDNNIITNNVYAGGLGCKIIGANSVGADNIKATEGATDVFKYCVADDKVIIIEALNTTITELVIPATIEDYPVVAIDAWAFALCDQLTTVAIPDSITSIGANAFYLCDALTNVHYTGSKADWEAVAIGVNNDALLNAAWYSPLALYSDTVRHSVMDTDNGNGLAFRFELQATGVKVAGGNRVSLTNATVDYFGTPCKLVGMGAVVTNNAAIGESDLTLDAVNGSNVVDVPTVYLQDWSETSCAFATRIINIPTTALTRTVYARPYCIIEVDGERITIYGNVDAASCAEYM